ncbi:MAG: hypothetical protein QM658_07030 [Gordonia sp. (in: high G+C Gram-positive bacteria)]
MSSLAALAQQSVYVLADTEPTQGPEFGKASPVGLLMVVLLLIATFLLIRSMNKQLRKLPESFDTAHPEADQQFDEGTDSIEGEPDDDVEGKVDDGSATTSSGSASQRADGSGSAG